VRVLLWRVPDTDRQQRQRMPGMPTLSSPSLPGVWRSH
jgi:hypothetical protein